MTSCWNNLTLELTLPCHSLYTIPYGVHGVHGSYGIGYGIHGVHMEHSMHIPCTFHEHSIPFRVYSMVKISMLSFFIHHSIWNPWNPPIPLVFTGPVHWTGKKTEIGQNPTAKDRTTGCGCTNSEFLQLPVAMFVEKSKNRKKPVFHPIMCWTLLTHIFP